LSGAIKQVIEDRKSLGPYLDLFRTSPQTLIDEIKGESVEGYQPVGWGRTH